MHITKIEQIKSHPSFIEMERKKSRLGMIFSLLTVLVYFTYIIWIGTSPASFGTPVAAGQVTTWGIYWGVFVILFSIAITAIYVHKANGEFDALTKKVIDDINQDTTAIDSVAQST